MKLWYKQPATSWVEALPVGNGRLGGMIYGQTNTEQISLNEDTLWSGYPRELNPRNKREIFQQSIQLTKDKKYDDAQKLIEGELTSGWTQSYMPIGDLLLTFEHSKEVTGFTRSLDLLTGVAHVAYEIDQVCYTREIFASAPNDIIIIKISANKPQSISFKLSFESLLHTQLVAEEDYLVLEGGAPSYVEPTYSHKLEEPIVYSEKEEEKGMLFAAMAKVRAIGGTVTYSEQGIEVEKVDSAIIFLNAQTSFDGYDVQPYLNGKDYISLCKKGIEEAIIQSYEDLLEEHIKDYQYYFERVALDIGENERANLPTDERLYQFKEDQNDPSLYTLLFQYGRYLMIAASRVGTQATNLQGIWNSEIRPPWSSNYTLNINTQMNYWPAFLCGLGEFQEPLVRLIKEIHTTGQRTARELYGVEGFVSHHNTDIWRLASPVGDQGEGSACYAFWNGSAGWLCRHLFEQYEYTLDRDFLRNEAYPIMKSAAQFILNILIEDKEGYLIICPSTSPENTFIYEGKRHHITETTTMSMAIARELFRNCIRSCEILECDAEWSYMLQEKLEKFYPYKIGSKGQLLEWYEEYEEEDIYHRHISHLYGLYPGNEITMVETPQLAQACKNSLNSRGDGGTGWSLGWKINQWARLQDGDRALKLLSRQLRVVGATDVEYSAGGGTYINLFDAHPPFQIDGNFAATAGIAEMLVQSLENKLYILPALPTKWQKGFVKGLCAKGTLKVAIAWDKTSVKVELTSEINQTILVHIKNEIYEEVKLIGGNTLVIEV